MGRAWLCQVKLSDCPNVNEHWIRTRTPPRWFSANRSLTNSVARRKGGRRVTQQRDVVIRVTEFMNDRKRGPWNENMKFRRSMQTNTPRQIGPPNSLMFYLFFFEGWFCHNNKIKPNNIWLIDCPPNHVHFSAHRTNNYATQDTTVPPTQDTSFASSVQ